MSAVSGRSGTLRLDTGGPAWRLAPLTAGMFCLAALLWIPVAGGGELLAGDKLVWVLLAVAFVITEGTQLHVEARRQTLSVSLSEIPLVLGLFLLGPVGLLATRLTGAAVVGLARRTAPYKQAFNAAMFATEVAVLELVFLALDAGAAQGPRAWAASYLAILVATPLSGTAVVGAITRLQGRLNREDLGLLYVPLLISAVLNTTVALLVIQLARTDVRTVLLLCVLFGALVVVYRAYSSLLRRHKTLDQMHRFATSVSGAEGSSQLLSEVLEHARSLLKANRATLWIAPDDSGPVTCVSSVGDPEPGVDRRPSDGDGASIVFTDVLASGGSHLLPRSVRDPALRSWLSTWGLRDAAVVPLTAESGASGLLLVGDRLGEMGTFTRADLTLLELVAAHVSVALHNGTLVDRLRHEAHHDALTGLPNRTLFHVRLDEAIAAHTGTGRVAVLLMDLDGFKDVNDTLGHSSGDRLLQQVAARLRRAVPDTVTVTRLGGDEFALLVPLRDDAGSADSADDAMSVAELLTGCLRRPFGVDGVQLEVRASLGVAVSPDHGSGGTVLLQRADVAMYAAKRAGLSVQMYDAALDRSNPARLALVGELRRALDEDQLCVYYQPKVSLSDGQPIGVEALVRWQHPTLGMVSPDDFIPIAEHTGLIMPLTTVVLRSALRQCRAWLDEGRRLGVAVNISTRSLLSTEFSTEVRDLLAETGVPASLLTLEITESSVMSDAGRAMAVLGRLHDLGLRLSVDDFGTGYSSLSYLQRLPVDEVKIDKSFVVDLATNRGNAAIVRAIVDLGHTLGLQVVAEGVEDQRSRQMLAELGCDTAQGFLLSRPLALPALQRWLEESAVADPTAVLRGAGGRGAKPLLRVAR